jgi:hypothetical protein
MIIKTTIFSTQFSHLGLYEMKQHKPWLDEECLRVLGQTQQAKI